VVCDGTDNSRCMTDAGWTLHRDHAQTVVVSNDRDYLVLSLAVGGFHGDAGALAAGSDSHHQQIAELSFEFETQCSHECYFALLRVCLCVSVWLCVSWMAVSLWPNPFQGWRLYKATKTGFRFFS